MRSMPTSVASVVCTLAPGYDLDRAGHIGNITRVIDRTSSLEGAWHLECWNIWPIIVGILGSSGVRCGAATVMPQINRAIIVRAMNRGTMCYSSCLSQEHSPIR